MKILTKIVSVVRFHWIQIWTFLPSIFLTREDSKTPQDVLTDGQQYPGETESPTVGLAKDGSAGFSVGRLVANCAGATMMWGARPGLGTVLVTDGNSGVSSWAILQDWHILPECTQAATIAPNLLNLYWEVVLIRPVWRIGLRMRGKRSFVRRVWKLWRLRRITREWKVWIGRWRNIVPNPLLVMNNSLILWRNLRENSFKMEMTMLGRKMIIGSDNDWYWIFARYNYHTAQYTMYTTKAYYACMHFAFEINNFAHLLCFHPNLHRSGCQLAVSCITCITQTGMEK